MKILILGGSNSQINAILNAKRKGHVVIVSDYYDDAPGKLFSDYNELTSTFDVPGNINIARKYDIDGVMTLGTDQPVYTAARVSEALKLPAFIDVDTAKAVTNKKVMKCIFKESNIPTVNYRILKSDFTNDELKGIKFPVVIKPLDSQGQRGVYKLDSISDIKRLFPDVLSYSREDEILLEEYYESDEITMCGWVVDGEPHIITVTDRVTYDNYPHIGICTSHNFPSKYLKSCIEDISCITEKIVRCFKIKNGPIYFQMLIGQDGIKVNEIACRIGGAYEDEFIPLISGIDILDMVIDYSLGIPVDYTKLKNYSLQKNNNKAVVQMIFARPGLISSIGDMKEIKKLPGVVQAKYNFKQGSIIGEIVNATQRAGYMIIQGSDDNILSQNLNTAFENLTLYDENGQNMILRI